MNTFTLTDILIIVSMHTIFDWLFQSRWQAENKSKNWLALTSHVVVYNLGLAIAGGFLLMWTSPLMYVTWVLGNSVLHFITDAITSRLNAKFYPTKAFWNTIGIDQLIHYATLFTTLYICRK